MLCEATYKKCVAARRAFVWPGFETYAEAGLDGDYVTPYHMTCGNRAGPVLISFNWLDAPTTRKYTGKLKRLGYLPDMLFNRVLDLAIGLVGLQRSDIYLTHAVHLLAKSRSATMPASATAASFDTITRHEIAGRPVIALGQVAAAACARHGVTFATVPHLSARGQSAQAKAEKLAEALRAI